MLEQRKLAVMDPSVSIYQYIPIHASQEIRVLQLEPATSFAKPIVTHLFLRKIDEVDYPQHPLPTYHGVSYCWGAVQDVVWMMCDGQRLKITKNVDVMLRHLRKEHLPRNLWVDAICINQANDAEKAEQVGRMDRIYECADKVHIWLGTAAPKDEIQSIFAVLRNWALRPRHLPPIDLNGVPPPLLAAIDAFLARPWFARRWILQEVKLAHTVTVHCGQHRISWAWIRHVMDTLSATGNRENRMYLRLALMLPSIFGALEGFRSLEHNINPTTTILDLLWDFHFSLCRDKRDRLFALYGIWARTGRPSSYPDDEHESREPNLDPYIHCPVTYSSDFASVYSRLATAAIKSGTLQANGIISHVLAFGSLAQQNPNWPSWVPSWNLARKSPEKMTLSQHRSFVCSLPSIHVPELGILGSIYPVTTLHNNAGAGATMAFFRYIFEEPQAFECSETPDRVAASMLCRVMTISGALYDKAELDFDAVFTRSGKSSELAIGSDDRDAALMKALILSFRRSSLAQIMPDLMYSPKALSQEIDRLTQGTSLFQYEYHGQDVPGVAITKVEHGDYVFRAYGSTGSDIALILRPHIESFQEEFSSRRRSRIIGYCVDYEPWDKIPRARQSIQINIA
jgi:hypothetical protein